MLVADTATCPGCGASGAQATSVHALDRSASLSICIECAAVCALVVDQEHIVGLRLLTEDERDELDPKDQAALHIVQSATAKLRRYWAVHRRGP